MPGFYLRAMAASGAGAFLGLSGSLPLEAVGARIKSGQGRFYQLWSLA